LQKGVNAEVGGQSCGGVGCLVGHVAGNAQMSSGMPAKVYFFFTCKSQLYSAALQQGGRSKTGTAGRKARLAAGIKRQQGSAKAVPSGERPAGNPGSREPAWRQGRKEAMEGWQCELR